MPDEKIYLRKETQIKLLFPIPTGNACLSLFIKLSKIWFFNYYFHWFMNLFLSFFFILRFSATLKYVYVRELNIDVHIKISKNKRFNKAKFWCGVLLNNRRMKNRIFFFFTTSNLVKKCMLFTSREVRIGRNCARGFLVPVSSTG